VKAAMATSGQPIEQLCEFLASAFEKNDLNRFLVFEGYRNVAEGVNRDVSNTEYVFNVVQAMNRQALIDGNFFDRLAEERPAREAEVRRIQQSWQAGNPKDVSISDRHSAPAVDRRTLLRTISGLTPSDFDVLVASIQGAATQISRQGTVPQQAAQLIGWAESSRGPGLAAIQQALEDTR
jgi:hypothetical protein